MKSKYKIISILLPEGFWLKSSRMDMKLPRKLDVDLFCVKPECKITVCSNLAILVIIETSIKKQRWEISGHQYEDLLLHILF